LENILSKLNLENKDEIYDNYCNNYTKPSFSYNNNNNYNNGNENDNNNMTKYYDLYLVKNYIQNFKKVEILKNNINNFLHNDEFFNVVFETFDYLMFKDIDYLLKKGSIEKNEESIPTLLKFEMLKKDYIKSKREIIWTLLIEYSY